jgi:hypothetical protein
MPVGLALLFFGVMLMVPRLSSKACRSALPTADSHRTGFCVHMRMGSRGRILRCPWGRLTRTSCDPQFASDGFRTFRWSLAVLSHHVKNLAEVPRVDTLLGSRNIEPVCQELLIQRTCSNTLAAPHWVTNLEHDVL